ncbi:glycosyl transferase [Desulfovibrio subterraneus]|jgi:glycosyltransferase involved in cell wall biosynthesis|uniref:Glycosyl transferase n=2 Tax=Desulfovibrio subterraneus TaxID=2718620 RepID=A0A7J0BJW8_9BACT|nr:glycosyl transferase [Desulfovibrio subterraneus]
MCQSLIYNNLSIRYYFPVMTTIKSLSIVVPVYNEEDNLPILFAEIERAMSRTDKDWHVIFVDDGSKDRSLEVMRQLAEKHDTVRYVVFAQNCGQSAAFKAGFDAATGDVVVTMDADLQNDPADIPAMLQEYERGFDMVIGWRAKRQDSIVKKIVSKIGNGIRNRLSNETVKDTGCSLKVMRTSMAQLLPMFTGMHRFLPTLMKMQGAKVAEVRVNHRPRQHGVSKYGVWDRTKATFFDLLAIRWMQKRTFRYTIREQK